MFFENLNTTILEQLVAGPSFPVVMKMKKMNKLNSIIDGSYRK